MIKVAAEILEEIQPATVRAVCYRLFVAGLIESMNKNETNKVSRHLVDARESGAIPWEWIVDETRAPERISTWRDPRQIFEAAAREYRFDYWSMQPLRVEVWSEKGTVRGTIAPVLQKYAVDMRVMHGHGSATALYDAAQDSMRGKPLTVLYIGDYDPSGMHMSEEDIPDRIQRYDGDIELHRIAIVHSDTSNPDIPSFDLATKVSDPRHNWFRATYGARCWELDALNPAVLRDRVEAVIRTLLDEDAWQRAVELEDVQRQSTNAYVNALPASILGQASKC